MKLRNPDTGTTVYATAAGAKVLLARGYIGLAGHDASEEKPLGKMKLAELLERAAEVGVAAETLAELGKPGTSKAAVIAAIEALEAAKSGGDA